MPLATPDSPRIQENSVAVTLRVAVARIYRALRFSASSQITPSQASVLFRIEQSGPLRMGVLARQERITPASLSKVVDSLDALGLVEREPDPLDGRGTLLSVSATGRRLIREQRAASTQALEEALSKLALADQRVLDRSLPALERLADILLSSVDDD